MEQTFMHYKGTDIYDLFFLTVNIFNLEEKLQFTLSDMHPFKSKKMELINELSNRGLNQGDFIDIDNKAKEYIEKNR